MKKAILAVALLVGALGSAGCQGARSIEPQAVETAAERVRRETCALPKYQVWCERIPQSATLASATGVDENESNAAPAPGKKKAGRLLCGAPTKDGGTCKRRVRREGLRCWMHGGPGAAELDAEKPAAKE